MAKRTASLVEASKSRLYSTPADARAVVAALGSPSEGRYLLAPTFGNVDGLHDPSSVELELAIGNGVVKVNLDTDGDSDEVGVQ